MEPNDRELRDEPAQVTESDVFSSLYNEIEAVGLGVDYYPVREGHRAYLYVTLPGGGCWEIRATRHCDGDL